jgi:hypothetical protein
VCLQAWEEDLTRPCAADGWDHHAPYSRHIGGYRPVHRIYPQAEGTRPSADVTPQLVVRSVALTPAAQATLEQLIAQASTAIGRKASASAVVRALLQWAEQEHLGAELVRLIAAELQTGEVVWGKAKQHR